MHKSVGDLLFIEAGQLLPDVLIRGVEGSVNLLWDEETKHKEKPMIRKCEICYRFICSGITGRRMNLNFQEPLFYPVVWNIWGNCSLANPAAVLPLNNLIK